MRESRKSNTLSQQFLLNDVRGARFLVELYTVRIILLVEEVGHASTSCGSGIRQTLPADAVDYTEDSLVSLPLKNPMNARRTIAALRYFTLPEHSDLPNE
jgi:hypothetical protein